MKFNLTEREQQLHGPRPYPAMQEVIKLIHGQGMLLARIVKSVLSIELVYAH